MADIEIPRILYLVILGAAIFGWFLAEYKGSLGQGLRMAMAWGMIFIGVMAGYALWGEYDLGSQSAVVSSEAIEVPRANDGHFHMTLTLDGTPVRFVVDTGATDIVLSKQDAERIGLDPDQLIFSGIAGTANGTVRTAFARVDMIELGPVQFQNVGISVNGGDLDQSLLGMAFLNRFERIEIAEGRLRLEL